jgi:hypothetical protein
MRELEVANFPEHFDHIDVCDAECVEQVLPVGSLCCSAYGAENSEVATVGCHNKLFAEDEAFDLAYLEVFLLLLFFVRMPQSRMDIEGYLPGGLQRAAVVRFARVVVPLQTLGLGLGLGLAPPSF